MDQQKLTFLDLQTDCFWDNRLDHNQFHWVPKKYAIFTVAY